MIQVKAFLIELLYILDSLYVRYISGVYLRVSDLAHIHLVSWLRCSDGGRGMAWRTFTRCVGACLPDSTFLQSLSSESKVVMTRDLRIFGS